MNHQSFNVPSLEAMSTLLPAFDFEGILASNDYGAVFLANQRSLERQVAIKVLAPNVSEDPAFRESFESTARSMAKLNHPNLISVFDSGCVDKMLYFVMEFVPGKSLERSTKGQPIEFQQVMLLIEGICSGLAHAHDHQIIHGDLNLSSILLNQKAEPKIGSFGFAHTADDTAAAKATSHCIAPEHLNQKSVAATIQSDIFSVGAIFYELITGQQYSNDALPPSSFSVCGPKVDEVLQQATAVDPSQRPTDIRTFLKALKEAAGPIGRSAAITPAAQRLTLQAKPATTGTQPRSQPSTSELTQTDKVGFNWSLLRNLFIIVGLIFAIRYAWVSLKSAREQRDRQNQELVAKEAAEKKAKAEAREKLRLKKLAETTPEPLPIKPNIPKVTETPEESLSRLRSALASGKRTEMPFGSIPKGDHDYLLVSEPMSWPDAAWFAEQHGGHLAIPNPQANMSWLVEKFPSNDGFWIGGARNGRHSWALADGTAWKPTKEPTCIGQYVSADKHGFLHADNAKSLHPFIIQWHRDGSNPGALANLLATTRSSLSQANPIFPPGTRTYGVRHYLYVSRPLTWRDAVDLAQNAGGNLMVPSNLAEIINLEGLTDELITKNGIWLGGFLKGDKWVWITGEPWKTAKWAKNSTTTTPDSALVIRPGTGWDAQNLSEHASGFIIEWSDDGKSTTAPNMEGPAPISGASQLVTKAKSLIVDADAKRTEKLAKNVHKLSWDLNVYMRGLNRSDQDLWGPHVERLKLCAKNNRMPSAIPASSGIKLSDKMARLAEYCTQQQDKIDLEFIQEVDKIKTAFVAKLIEDQTKAKQAGQPKLAETIGKTIDSANDSANWVRSFGVEFRPENPVLEEEIPDTQPFNPLFE